MGGYGLFVIAAALVLLAGLYLVLRFTRAKLLERGAMQPAQVVSAPSRSHAFNIAAITAAIATGREAYEDPSKRWIAVIAASVCYILVGVSGVTLASVFMAFPASFITTLAGLALLGTTGGSAC